MNTNSTKLESALKLAEMGFYVHPLKPNSKAAVVKGWPERASRDLDQIKQWWLQEDYNIGLHAGKFGGGKAMVVVDVDCKGSKNGNAELLRLELNGFELPSTLTATTPSGGRHLYFLAPHTVKTGVDVLAPGLDIRSHNGYVVGHGSM